jgi:hypothetical protein
VLLFTWIRVLPLLTWRQVFLSGEAREAAETCCNFYEIENEICFGTFSRFDILFDLKKLQFS